MGWSFFDSDGNKKIKLDSSVMVGAGVFNAKGDLVTGLAPHSFGVLPAGANNTILRADSGETNGLEWASLLGTTNQVIITNNENDVTISLPQDIAASSIPTFGGLTLTGSLNLGGNKATNAGEPTVSTDLATKNYVDSVVANVEERFYLLDSASGVGSYKNLSISDPELPQESVTASSLGDGDTLIQGWISASDESPVKLLEGIYELHVHAEKTAGTKTVRLYYEIVEYKTDTSEVVIATSGTSDELPLTETHFDLHANLADDYIPDSGSRIVGKIYAQVSGGGSAPSVAIYYLGDTASAWKVPTSPEILTHLFVPYDGAVKDVDLGAKNLLTSGTVDGVDVSDLNSSYTSHAANTSNPHSVTKSQVGLGNVENTALSSWPGTTNITTLGTIGTGTWQGTPIANAYVAGLDQDLLQSSSPTFAGLTINGSITVTGNVDGRDVSADGAKLDTALQSDGSVSLTDDWNVDGSGTLFIDKTNNRIGIGTLSPEKKLHVAGGDILLDNDQAIRFKNAAGTYNVAVIGYDNSNNMTIGGGIAGDMIFKTNSGVEAMRVKSSGQVGINEDSPGARLQITYSDPADIIRLKDSDTGDYYSFRFDASGNLVLRYNNGTNDYYPIKINRPLFGDALTIDSSGRVGISTNSSTAVLDINSDVFRLRTSKTPSSASDTGNQGDICWDSNYVYICVATNTWKRAALNTW